MFICLFLCRFQSVFLIPLNAWTLIGLNFNSLWEKDDMLDLFYIFNGNKVKSETFEMAPTTVSIDAVGSIRMGMNFDDKKPFSGKMACIQFYPTSLIGGTQEEVNDVCDPSMWPGPDYGKRFVTFKIHSFLLVTGRTLLRRH